MTWIVAGRTGELGACQGEVSTRTRAEVGAGIVMDEQQVDCHLVTCENNWRVDR